MTVTLSSSLSATDQITVSYGVPFRTNPPLKDTLGNYAGSNSAVVSITQRPNSEPEFPTSDDSPTFNENASITNRVARYTAADPERDSFEWSVGGTDASSFTIDTSGNLKFNSQPDHEGQGRIQHHHRRHRRRRPAQRLRICSHRGSEGC